MKNDMLLNLVDSCGHAFVASVNYTTRFLKLAYMFQRPSLVQLNLTAKNWNKQVDRLNYIDIY